MWPSPPASPFHLHPPPRHAYCKPYQDEFQRKRQTTTCRLESIVRRAVDDRGRRRTAATTLRPRLISDGVAD
eukprot:3455197-Rhodomonas_salina.1